MDLAAKVTRRPGPLDGSKSDFGLTAADHARSLLTSAAREVNEVRIANIRYGFQRGGLPFLKVIETCMPVAPNPLVI